MMALSPEEVHIITQYRKLHHGQLIITKRDGKYADGETKEKWDKGDVRRPKRRLREPVKE